MLIPRSLISVVILMPSMGRSKELLNTRIALLESLIDRPKVLRVSLTICILLERYAWPKKCLLSWLNLSIYLGRFSLVEG
jgi:hypothetical protein